jgi:putative SOS response-associated peptidase YedK
MCGRFAVTLPPEAMRQFFRYIEQPNFPPRFNIAPTQAVPILRGERDGLGSSSRHFSLVRWGFLPHFVKDPKSFPLIINAKAETLREKASFKNALKRRRCLFMADAFYEWRREGKGKAGTPFLLARQDHAPMGLAGLWETWSGPNGEEVDTACIITVGANGATSAIHERLPAVLEQAAFDLWLACDEASVGAAYNLLKPPENNVLDFFEIGPAINKVANDSASVQLKAEKNQSHASTKASPAAPAKPEQGSLF